MRSVELFAGCGGLALGLSRAGFRHALVVERDDQAYTTLAENKRRKVDHVRDWPLAHQDVRQVDYGLVDGAIDLVAGGPPCQPFSIGGRHLGPEDGRNMWPEAVRAVGALMPKAFLFENVKGLLRPAFAEYLGYLAVAFSWPEIPPWEIESWRDHGARLARHAKANAGRSTYKVIFRAINTADYGASQKRHRALAIGVRSDIADDWSFLAPTHSREALLWSQLIAGNYWARHGLDVPPPAKAPAGRDRVVTDLRQRLIVPSEQPWVTVRDAIGDLPEPTLDASDVDGHRLHPGARVYARHTGSTWDEPAKALKAGDHGVPGGENVLVGSDGSVRYFTLREMARLQGLPDEFHVPGTWKAPIRQLGNAVPVQLGEVLGTKIRSIIEGAKSRHTAVAA